MLVHTNFSVGPPSATLSPSSSKSAKYEMVNIREKKAHSLDGYKITTCVVDIAEKISSFLGYVGIIIDTTNP